MSDMMYLYLFLAFNIGLFVGAWTFKTVMLYRARAMARQATQALSSIVADMETEALRFRERADLVTNALSRAGQEKNDLLMIKLIGFFKGYEDKHGHYPTATELDRAIVAIGTSDMESVINQVTN